MSGVSNNTALDSAYNNSGSTTKTTGKSELDRDAFLMLLVTQFQYQDPLNPMEDKEFIAQLAQFSALEQSMQMNESITSLTNEVARQTSINITNYIGKEVSARGYGISKSGSDVSVIQFAGAEEMASCSINILDASGTIVRTVSLGSQSSGIHDFVWDGKKTDGSEAPDGTYTVALSGKNSAGDMVYIDTSVSGRVTGTSSYNGEYYLSLSGGRTVLLSNVREVLEAQTTDSATQGTEIMGTDGDDYLVGEDGAADTISAGGGNDIIVYDALDKMIDGGDGFDFLIASGDLQKNYKNIEAVIRGSDASGIQSLSSLEKYGVTITDGKLDMTTAAWQNNWKEAGTNQWSYTGGKKLSIEILDTSKIIIGTEEEEIAAQAATANFSARSTLSETVAQQNSFENQLFAQELASGMKNATNSNVSTLKEKASGALSSYIQGLLH